MFRISETVSKEVFDTLPYPDKLRGQGDCGMSCHLDSDHFLYLFTHTIFTKLKSLSYIRTCIHPFRLIYLHLVFVVSWLLGSKRSILNKMKNEKCNTGIACNIGQ